MKPYLIVACILTSFVLGCTRPDPPERRAALTAKPGKDDKGGQGTGGNAASGEAPSPRPAVGGAGDPNEPGEKSPPSQKTKSAKIDDEALKQAADKFAQGVREAAPPQPAECRWALEAIEIDGRADDVAWEGAEVFDDFRLPWLKENERPARTKTSAKLLWDQEYLYFFADMEDSDLYADVTEPDGETWKNDVFELFFKPDRDKPGYYEFQVNAAGTPLDMYLPRRGAGDYQRFRKDGEFNMQAVVVRRGTLNDWKDEDEGWSVEGRIPWKDFERSGGGPQVGDEWTFALCRYDYSVAFEGPELSTTAPLSRLSFHQHEDYAPLRFVGPKRTSHRWPHGLEKRSAWTTSNVVGSPEPPHPYRIQPAFPNLQIKQPLALYPEPGTENLLVIQHLAHWRGPGRILRIADDPQASEAKELLALDYIAYGLAFHPDFEQNGYVYVGMNGPIDAEVKKTRVARYTISRQPPYDCDAKSEKLIIDWESDGHNGGDLGFGNDGMLYITAGDGTSDSDTDLTGQDLTNLCATVIRIDVDHPDEGRAYSVPPDNPFLDTVVEEGKARPEIWAFGFRNPWRMFFDQRTGLLWVAQNGQDLWEQVMVVRRGDNFGWSIMEGGHPFYLNRRRGPTPIMPPLVDHPHSEARSLTGGVVYYGQKLPELFGAYLYGDWSTGKIWAIKYDGQEITWHREITDTTLQIGGFGLDHDGELVVIDQGGGKAAGDAFYRLQPTPDDIQQAEFPRRLSETGLFDSVEQHAVQPGVISYSVVVPQWSDGATAERYFALPGNETISMTANRGWNLPEGAVVVKTLSIQTEAGKPASRRRIETQMLTRQQGEWQAYTYAWNDEQTDADLVGKDGSEIMLEIADSAEPGGVRKQRWRFAARTECMACHSRAANYLLGLSTPQMNTWHDYGLATENQLRALARAGVLPVTWKEHEAEWWQNAVRAVRSPLESAVGMAGTLAGNVWFADGDAADDGKAADAKPGPSPWNLPDDVALFLPSPLEWSRRGVAAARNDVRKQWQWLNARAPRLPKPPSKYPKLVDPWNERADLTARARSYIHANCAHCHVGAGGGNAAMELEFHTPDDEARLLGEIPKHDKFGLTEAQLVAPGEPERSVLLYRLAKLGGGRMPRLGSSEVDPQAVNLIRDWIASLPADENETGSASAELVAERKAVEEFISSAAAGEATDAKMDNLLSTTSGAMLLAGAIDSGRLTDGARNAVIASGANHASAPVRDLFERYIPLDERTRRLGGQIDVAALLALPGDAVRGERLFRYTSSVQCKSCHQVDGDKPSVGPSLVDIARRLDRREMLESIVLPSKKIDEKYATHLVATTDGRLLSGLLIELNEQTLVLRDAKNQQIMIPAGEIDELRQGDKSLMPEGLLQDLTAQQAADLLEYLTSLKPAVAEGAPPEPRP